MRRRFEVLPAVMAVAIAAGMMVWVAVYENRGEHAAKHPTDPQGVLERYREAVWQGDRAALADTLSTTLRQQTDTLLQSAQSRLNQTVSWVVVEGKTEEAAAWFIVHEMSRDGFIYPVRYQLEREGGTWRIARIAELPPQRAPIAPGTHIREVLGQDTTAETGGRSAAASHRASADDSEEETVP
jgi:hypothetical protein